MNRRLGELHVRRGQLIERIAAQRTAISRDFEPVGDALHKADAGLAVVRSVVDKIKQHPVITAAMVIGVGSLKKGRLWRWAKRAVSLWQIWRLIERKRMELGLRARL
ncbi:YqjK-like family protein [Propionivibrio soli]|jgi:hypothetical protein|uniref:YqjK-like family protein n=1 Tax=Propionivibrio soli TaxID=2976531 RepID=UPI0021E91C51|nr:YqjK-like family protein [Propionivibrio soli]